MHPAQRVRHDTYSLPVQPDARGHAAARSAAGASTTATQRPPACPACLHGSYRTSGDRVITDLLLDPLYSLALMVLGWLPEVELRVPETSGLGHYIAGLDQIVPIAGPIQLGLGVLSALVVFVVIRLVLVVINIVWW
jgi:hypothetical protein